jgi:hypothetical protein
MKQIKGFENYLITLDGKVFSLITMKFLKSKVTNAGYEQIQLFCGKGNYKYFSVHRLVADAYISNTENKPQVNHMDGNKLNNLRCNLEWMTASENQKHCSDTGLRKVDDAMRERGRYVGKMCGAENGRKARLKTSKIILDESNGIYYTGINEAALVLGLKPTTLKAKLNGQNKNLTTFKYV